MLLVESEATTRQCPEQQVSGYTFNLQNSGNGAFTGAMYATNTAALCVASRCMMWRWGDDMKTKGYCGKAGKP